MSLDAHLLQIDLRYGGHIMNALYHFIHVPMAQWIRRLPTEQEIPGSSPGRDYPFSHSKRFGAETSALGS